MKDVTARLATCKYLLLTLVLTAGVGCADTMTRSAASGYDRTSPRSDERNRHEDELYSTASDLGYVDPSDLSGRDLDVVNRRLYLEKAESYLEGTREREQYFKNKPYMKSDDERLAFLSLRNYDERQKWLDAHGINGEASRNPASVQALIDVNDIALGMTKQAVRDSWGPPETVEVSGNPLYGNERWLYKEQITSSEGYHTERRHIYFESGRVAGWDRQKEQH